MSFTRSALQRMEAIGRIVQSAMSVQSDDSYVPPSPFIQDGTQEASYARLMPEVGDYAWIRLCCDTFDRDTITVQLPSGSTYKLSKDETVQYMTALGHDNPESFTAMATNFYDAIWYPDVDRWHIVTEHDRELWFVESTT